jgi:S-adenosyl-L-methionine hydrolase (adenosine-forming)
MKGVIATRAPGVSVVDLSHGVPPQDVIAGALVLRASAPYFPAGTVHVAVVDPGVGTARRPICVETADALFVGPDNGVLSLAAPANRVRRIVELANPSYRIEPASRTFHGRDVFAPAAAALATGVPASALGPALEAMQRVNLPAATRTGDRVHAEVVYVDGFGNLTTNVDAPALAGRLRIEIGGRRIDGVSETYGSVESGDLVAVVNSWGMLEIALRDGSARAALDAPVGTPLVLDVA